MKRAMLNITLGGAVLLAGLLSWPVRSEAGVSINITFPLPGLGIVAPPVMVVIPGTYAYYAPDVEANLFFYQGYWYRPYKGGWYYSLGFNGPWGRVSVGNLPPPLINLRPDYRNAPPVSDRATAHRRHGMGMGM